MGPQPELHQSPELGKRYLLCERYNDNLCIAVLMQKKAVYMDFLCNSVTI